MDFTVHRRPGGVKYGKTRKVRGYNFFDIGTNHAPIASAGTRFPISPSSPGSVLLDKEEPIILPESPSRSPSVKPAHVTTHSTSSDSHSNHSRSESPLKQSSETSGRPDQSMFDLVSSDDEHYGSGQPQVKKRKLAQPLKEKQALRPQTKAGSVTEKTNRHGLAKKQENMAAQSSNRGQKPKMRPTASNKQEPSMSTNNSRLEPKVSQVPEVIRAVTNTKLKKITYGKKNITATASRANPVHGDLHMEEATDWGREKQATAPVGRTRTTRARTPKKQQQYTIDSDTSTASPSQLGLKDLRLTPEEIRSGASSASASPAPAASLARRGRQRRIDLLDAPEDEESHPSTEDAAKISSRPPHSKLKPEAATETVAAKKPPPGLSRSGSSQTRQTYGRPRNTYGRERSHLGDMVNDLDALSNDSSQEASEQLLSQLSSQQGPSQLQTELDLGDISSDDAVSGTKLKSIHELRQAGTNNRFDRDLETLLEDIDPFHNMASKSLRLQALMKLFMKMTNEGFTSFASDRALDKLASWSKSVKDKLSKLLFDMVMWRLLHSKNTSPTKLRTIAEAVASSTALITNLHTMAQIAKDRKENLSKVLLRELAVFEKAVLQDDLLPSYEGDSIMPAAVAIGTLHDSLRRLAEAGATNVSVGREACRSIAAMLGKAAWTTSDGAAQHKYLTKLALSLLKLFAGPLESDLGMDGDEYLSLSNTLANILNHAVDMEEDLVQSVYHFAISLCNDRPHVCRQVILSNLPSAAMQIIEMRFPKLVDETKAGSSVDQIKLDSIILSLACLLNVTEHEGAIRQQFASSNVESGASAFQRLIALYSEAAPKLKEATTSDQVQVLVAFGYLSLLICNLCLDQDLWKTACRVLDGYSISDVVASAKELLIYMRTLDMAQLEADTIGIAEEHTTPVDGITQRFGRILAAVRVE